MCSIDLEPATLWKEHPVKARKAHECDGCWATISPGEAYLVHFSLNDGYATNEKACFACWATREQFADAHGQYCMPSNLMEQLQECIGSNDDEEDEWRPLLAGVRRRYRTSLRKRVFLSPTRPEVQP